MHKSLLVLVILFLCYKLISTLDEDNERILRSRLIKKLKKKFSGREGAVRLVGSSDTFQGDVEVFHKGKWGYICDDEWDFRDATVICKQLGFQTAEFATTSSRFSSVASSYTLDNVHCFGNETSIIKCLHDGWGNHDCSEGEVAGVVCHHLNKEITQSDMDDSPLKLKLSGMPVKLRLVEGRNAAEGRVEVFTEKSVNWTAICGAGWGLKQAQVVCKQMGLGYASHAYQLHKGSAQAGFSGVECKGDEINLAECTIDGISSCKDDHIPLAAVACTEYLPDLVLNIDELTKSAYLEDRPLYLLTCAMEENCLASSAYNVVPVHDYSETRRLLRFTTSVANRGNTDFRPSTPKEQWQFHQCHMHYHSMEVFATFDVLQDRMKVAEGHKASFCLEDNLCSGGARPAYACANYGDQGISVNCTDIYRHNIDCQWVDISDINPGIYTFKVAINPEYKIPEMRYDNNAAICSMYYGPSSVYIYNCQYVLP